MQTRVAEVVQSRRRLAALHELGLLDTPAEAAFDRLAKLAARILHTPVALVTLVDSDRQFFKSCLGLPEPWSRWRETPLSHSFCQHVVASGQPLVIPDARSDPKLLDNLAIRDLNVIAYLGSPLILPGGQVVGSFCVIDSKPRDWTDEQISIVRDLAASVMTEINIRHLHDSLQEQAAAQAAAMTAELRESEARYRDLVESSLDMICTHDLGGRLLSVNRRAGELLGYSSGELVGMNLRDLVVEKFRPGFDDYLAEIRRAGVARGHLQVQTRTGERRVWHYENTLRTEGVAQPLVRGTSHDVTEQYQAQKKLRDSEALYHELIDLAADGIFLSDAEGRFIVVNAAGCRLAGYAQDELLRLGIADLLPPDDRVNDPPRLEQLRSGKTVIRERRLLRKDGTILPVEINVKQLSGGRIQGIVRDITGRKAVEAEREKLLAELTTRNTEMENFIYTISHDLKTPLITIGGFASVLGRMLPRGDTPEARDSLMEIGKAVEVLKKHIEDLLTLARTGHVIDEKEPVALGKLIESVLALFTRQLRDTHASLQVATGLPVIMADPKGLQRVFSNLIDNALKYRREGVSPVIEIGAERVDDKLRLFVRDNGTGIRAKYRERVFELFQRAESRTEGTGVGLAIARRVIEVHGGRMWVDSETGQGSTFWIELPAAVIVDTASKSA